MNTNRKSRSEHLRKFIHCFNRFSCSKLKWGVLIIIVLRLGMGCATHLRVSQVYSGDRKPQDQIAILVVKDGVEVVELDGHDMETSGTTVVNGTAYYWTSYPDVLELKPGQYTAILEYRSYSAVGAPITVSLNMTGGHVYLLEPVKNWRVSSWSPELKDITNTSKGAKYVKDVDKCKNRKIQSLE